MLKKSRKKIRIIDLRHHINFTIACREGAPSVSTIDQLATEAEAEAEKATMSMKVRRQHDSLGWAK